MSDKMSEVEAAKKAVLEKWDDAAARPAFVGSSWVQIVSQKSHSVDGRYVIGAGADEDAAWIHTAGRLAPLTEDAPKELYCECGKNIVNVSDQFWRDSDNLVCVDNHWHKPAVPASPVGDAPKEIDWANDESAVRAAWPSVWFSPSGFIWKSESAFIGSQGTGDNSAMLGSSAKEARQHPTVVAFEREHNPAFKVSASTAGDFPNHSPWQNAAARAFASPVGDVPKEITDVCDCGHSKAWHSLEAKEWIPAKSGCLAGLCDCSEFLLKSSEIVTASPVGELEGALEETLYELERLARSVTPQYLESAQVKTENQYVECPHCNGDGEIYCDADYLNYDGAALGVQFYGIGNEHVTAEAYFRFMNPALALVLVNKLRAALSSNPAPECVDCRDYKENINTWVGRIGGVASENLSLTLGSLIESFLAIISAKDAEKELLRANALQEIESMGRLRNECMARAEAAEAELASLKERFDNAKMVVESLRASSAKVREDALREAAAVDIGLPIGAVDPVYEAGFGSGWRNAEYWFRKGIEKLLPTSPESQEAGQ